MHETSDDLAALQRLLDESQASAGPHLRRIFTDERRLRADELPALLPGVQVLNLATVNAACEPRVAPVDGLFYRARFYFGSSADSVRWRHLRARPQASAAHTRGEQLAVVVHGTAVPIDPAEEAEAGFRRYLLEVYGDDWEDWGGDAPYARIEPTRMYTFSSGG
ncbi:MAG TPA: pyridoxamine 5'-phosphate oxidase family protein [Actinomycetota bacterium]|nr:pyridoxamine 5'-phosphate oxidase family protein [Actinomycetota bacterium]